MADKATRGVPPGALVDSYRAEGGDLTRGYAVIAGTAEDQVKIAGAAAAAVGVMQETTSQDKVGPVVYFGPTVAIAGGGVSQWDWVKTDASGKLVTSAGEDTANVGRALSHADGDGDEFVIFVNPVKKRS